MIRRGFWLALGAAGGIVGYRRAAAAARRVAETLGARQQQPGAARRHWAREAIRFTRDVRDGMDQYYVRQAPAKAPSLGAGIVHDEKEDH